MNFLDILKLAFINLNRDKTRSFFTALGIIMGIASVVGIVAIGQGVYLSINEKMSRFNSNRINIMANENLKGFTSKLKETDAEAILRNCPSVSMASPFCEGGEQKVFFGNKNISISCFGIGENYFKIDSFNIDKGRFFTSKEISKGAKVCIIGKSIVDELFGKNINPIGKTIRLSRIPVKIIGTYNFIGYSFNEQLMNTYVFMPFSVVQKNICGKKHCSEFYISAISSEFVDVAKKEIENFLYRRHRIDKSENIDLYFQIKEDKEIIDSNERMEFLIILYLIVVASITLIVGGIGVMNIMLISVNERTREIGIRMAIGAKPSDIMWQFLSESVVLTCVGGIVGIICGIGVAKVIEMTTNYKPVVSFLSIVVSTAFSAYCGIWFGLYPAYKASQLDPVEAFRYE